MRHVEYTVSERGMVPVIEELLSEEVLDLYRHHVVRLDRVDTDGLIELGFLKTCIHQAEGCEVWFRRIPDTAGLPMSLAVHVPELPSSPGILYGIVGWFPSITGWYGEDFFEFCRIVHCTTPDGKPGNDDAICFIDDLVRRMLLTGAVVPKGVVP